MYLAHLMDLLGKGVVLSIDFDRTAFRIEHPRVVTFDGRSTDPAVFAKAAATCDGKVVMVIQDADHTKEEGIGSPVRLRATRECWQLYLIVEDGLVDLFRPGDGLGWLSDGPLAATEEFLRTNSEFVVDQDESAISSHPTLAATFAGFSEGITDSEGEPGRPLGRAASWLRPDRQGCLGWCGGITVRGECR